MEKKEKNEAIIFGGCAKLGDYFNVDPIWIRILFIIFGMSGTGIALYILISLLMD